ncbi:FANCI [Cordylochernes scorpioides]|uniref:FANCI n=1 Tax=Cordylochernes scorpioides TaxID=51811 RepID=A0ABY6JUN2_9ARAC|nr:FANCI [Cordylochernes scorpioides]
MIFMVESITGDSADSHLQVCSFPDSRILDDSCVTSREIPLTAEEQKFVIDKVSRALFDSENDDLPGLIYQMLLLSTKSWCGCYLWLLQETKKQAVEGILTFYFQRDQEVMSSEDSEDSKTESYSAANYRHAQGTVILHISLAAKQDVELGKEFLKILKGKQHSHPFLLSPFNLALSLSLLKIQAFEEQILDSIKKCILKVFQEKEKKSQSNWLRKILSQDLDPRKRILKMLQNSPKTPEEHASALGASLLLETFKVGWWPTWYMFSWTESLDDSSTPGSDVRYWRKSSTESSPRIPLGFTITLPKCVLELQVPSHILGKWGRFGDIEWCPELLSQSIQFAPQQLLSILAKFQHILDYLTFLPYSTAVHILRALTPLLKISPVLRDSLMLVLKKGLFNSAQDSRKISVNGILSILRNFKVASSIEDQELEGYFTMSQVPLDRITGNALKSSFNESLCMELLFFLRRSLAQQVEVRQLLYEGLRQVQERNPQISEYILEFLFEQFNNYYESDENRCPPLKIKDCLRLKLDNYHVLEPLDRLVSSIQYCYITAREEVPTDSEEIFSSNKIIAIMNEISSSFTSLIVRLVSTEIGDFELDKSAEYSTKTSVGSKNLNQALLLMGTCEALLEYAFMKEEHHPSPECGEQVLGLFRYFHKLAGLLKEKASGTSKKDEGGGGHRRGAIPPYKHILTLRCLASLASLLFRYCSHPEKELSKILHESKEFVDYVVSALHQKVNYISSIEHTQKTDKTMLHLKVIGKSMLALSSLPSCRRHKQASLDILSSLTTLIMVQYPDSLPDCLASLSEFNLGDISLI